MEGYCSTGQSPQRAVVPMEEEEKEEEEEEEEKEEEEKEEEEGLQLRDLLYLTQTNATILRNFAFEKNIVLDK
jgi:CO dehydrogenase/acetyl-CoA synthase beta subunit